MHEWALADAVVSTAISVAKKENLKEITKIVVKVGELQQINVDTFEFLVKEVIGNDPLISKAELDIRTEKGLLKCNVCANEWAFQDVAGKLGEEYSEAIHFVPEMAHIYARCPKCGSPDFEISQGRGVYIETIEGET
jgi:hydrogenase nickel incorporation protein HypA/HybF